MGFFNKNKQESVTTKAEREAIVEKNTGQTSTGGGRVSAIQSMTGSASTTKPTPTPKDTTEIYNTNTGIVSLLGSQTTGTNYTPAESVFLNSINPNTDSSGKTYQRSPLQAFASPFLGLDNNTYGADATYAEIMKANKYSYKDKLDFYNDYGMDQGYNFAESSNVYDEMVNQHWMIPDYSPSSDLYTLKQYQKSKKGLGMTDQEIIESYQQDKALLVNESLSQFANSKLAVLPDVSRIIGGDFKTMLKNTQPATYAGMTYNGANSSSNATADTGLLASYFDGTEIYSYDNIGEALVDEGTTAFQKQILTNNYYDYMKTGGNPEEFMSQLPAQVITNFKNNLVYDPKTNTATLYDYSPNLSSYEALHDTEFWRQQIDQQEGWLGGLFTSKDEDMTKLAQSFIQDPLYVYLSDGAEDGETFNSEKVTELQDAYNGTFKTDVDFSSRNAMEELIANYKAIPADDRITAKNELANSDLGLFLNKVDNDSRVQMSQSNLHTKDELDPSLGTKAMEGVAHIASTLESGAFAIAEIVSDQSGIGSFGMKASSKIAGATTDAVDPSGNATVDKAGNVIADIADTLTHPFTSFTRNKISGESTNSAITQLNNGEITFDEYTTQSIEELKSYDKYMTALDDAKVEASIAGETAKDEYKEEKGFFGSFTGGTAFKFDDDLNNVRENAYNETLRAELVKTLGEDEVAKMEEIAPLSEMANYNKLEVMEDYKKQILKVGKNQLSDDEYEKWVEELTVDEDTQAALDSYRASAATRKQALQEWFTPHYSNRGRSREGIRGYTQAYEQGVDNTNDAVDLAISVAFDPTTYLTFGGAELANAGIKVTRAGGKGIVRGVGETIDTGGNVFKNVAREFNVDLANQTNEALRKSLASKMGQSTFTDAATQNASRVENLVNGIDEMIVNMKKDIPELAKADMVPDAIADISERMTKLQNDVAWAYQKAAVPTANIDEASKIFKGRNYSRAERDQAYNVMTAHYNDLQLFNDEITNHLDLFTAEMQGLYDALPTDGAGPFKVKMGQYLEGLNGVLESDNKMRKFLNNKIKNSDSLEGFLEDTFDTLFDRNSTYQGNHGPIVLNKLLKNSDEIAEEVLKYISDDAMNANHLTARLYKLFDLNNIKGVDELVSDVELNDLVDPADLPKIKRQLSNSIHDIVDLVDNRLTERGRSVDRKFNINLDDNIPTDLGELMNQVNNNHTSVSNNLLKFDENIFNEISGLKGFNADIKKALAKTIKTQVIDGDIADTMGELNKVFRKYTKLYKKNVLALNEDMSDIQKTIAFYHDKGMLQGFSQEYLRAHAKKLMPTYEEFQELIKPDVIREYKRVNGLRPQISNSKLIEFVNNKNGYTKLDGVVDKGSLLRMDKEDLIGQEITKELERVRSGYYGEAPEWLSKELESLNTKKDILAQARKKYAFKGDSAAVKEAAEVVIPMNLTDFRKLPKKEIVSTLMKYSRTATTDIYGGLINNKTGVAIKDAISSKNLMEAMPHQYSAVRQDLEDDLNSLAISHGIPRINKIDDILQGIDFDINSPFSKVSFLEKLNPTIFQENIDFMEMLKEYNSVMSSMLLDQQNAMAMRGVTNEDLVANKALANLSELYKSVGKTAGNTPRNNIPNFSGEEIMGNIMHKYGASKITAYTELLESLPETQADNVFDQFTGAMNDVDYKEAVKSYARASRKSTRKADIGTTVAQYTRKLTTAGSDLAQIHDGVRRAYNVSNSVIKANQTQLQMLRKSLGKENTRKLDQFEMTKRMIKSGDAMGMSTRDFVYNTFLSKDTPISRTKQFVFSLDSEKMNSIVKDLKNVEIPMGEEDVFKLGDVFNIGTTTLRGLDFGEVSHKIDLTLKKDNPLIDNDKFKEISKYLRQTESDVDTYFDGENNINKPDVYQLLQESITDHMSVLHPDIFNTTGRINLTNQDMIDKVVSNIDKEIVKMKEYLNPEDIRAYIDTHTSVMAKLGTQSADMMNSIDPTGKLFRNSPQSKYYNSMLKSQGRSDFDDVAAYIPEMENTLMHTFYNKKTSKRVRKAKGDKDAPQGYDIFTNNDRHQNGIVSDASIKGSLGSKNKILQEVYGFSGDTIVTDLNTYSNHAAMKNIKNATHTAYANNLSKHVKSVKRGTADGVRRLGKTVEVSLGSLEEGLFAEYPHAYDNFVNELSKTHSMNRNVADNVLVFDKGTFNYLQHMGVNIRDLSDPSKLAQTMNKINGMITQSMLLGSFNAKALLSTIPNLIMTPGGNGLQSINQLVNLKASGRDYNKRIAKNFTGYMGAIQELSKIEGGASFEQIMEVGQKHLKGKDLEAWRNKHKFDMLRGSSSTAGKNYHAYKPLTDNWRGDLEFNLGSEPTFGDTIAAAFKGGANLLLPNMSVFDNAVLARAGYLVDNPQALNTLMRSNYGEELIEGIDFQDLSSAAMRLAESEFGVTDGMLNSRDTLLDTIFYFRNQLISGIPNILATYLGTPEGLVSTFNMQRRFMQIGAATSGMSTNELQANMDDDDYGKLMIGGTVGDATKLITMNSYSPLDVVNQFVGQGKSPIGVFFDTLSPVVKYPLEMAYGDDLGNYNSSSSHIDKLADARAAGDSKEVAKQTMLAGLEASTGNIYRWGNQIQNLMSGKDDSGKQLMFFPGSTDAEINMLDNIYNNYNIKLKDGYIDEIPFISTLFNSKNMNNLSTENTINLLQNISYNDAYMDGLANDETRPNASTVRSGIYSAIDKTQRLEFLASDANLDKEMATILEGIQTGKIETVQDGYNDATTVKDAVIAAKKQQVRSALAGIKLQ